MIQNLLKFSFVLFASLFIASCGEDSILDSGPNVSFSGSTGSDITINAGESFTVSINASENGDDLNGLEIRENGSKIDVSRVLVNNASIGGNPILLLGSEKTSFSGKEITILGASTVGTSTYDFIVLDVANNSSKVTKSVTIEQALPLVLTYNGADERTSNVSEQVAFNFSATKGSSKIVTLEVLQNDLVIANLTRISVEGNTSNSMPIPLGATFHDGFTNQNVVVQSPDVAGIYKYTFIFGDEVGTKVSKDVIVRVGSALTINGNEVLFNAAGPGGSNGGLDLDTGKNVPSNSPDSEIQDLGIDLGKPAATNWIQKIEPENGASLRLIQRGANVEITYDFTKVAFKEEIASLWEKGTDITTSPVMEALQIYVVKKGNNYYAFEVNEVNVTTGDNLDNYELTIKW